MPANLPPQYIAAEKKLRSTKDPQEKIVVLEEMWALLPKHKGTDKIQADIKRRISRLKKQAEKTGKKAKGFSLAVVREGAGQVAVVGPPNSGKSSLVSLLTRAEPKVAPYPFTTVLPCPAMMPHLDVQVQLVDLPPVAPGHVEFWLVNIIRNADALLLVLDVSGDDCLERLEEVVSELDRRMVGMGKAAESVEEEPGYVRKRTLLVANKTDIGRAGDNIGVIEEFFGEKLSIVPFSCVDSEDKRVSELRACIFELLKVIRIYSKEPGKKPDLAQPFTVKEGSTVLDFAAHVHRDFASGLAKARVWGSARFDGQAVSRDHILRDGDIVELTI